MKKLLLSFFMLAFAVIAFGQAKKITVEKIWDDFYFYPRGVAGYTAMPKSDCYTVVKRGGIERYSFASGELIDMLLSNADLERLSGGTVERYLLVLTSTPDAFHSIHTPLHVSFLFHVDE